MSSPFDSIPSGIDIAHYFVEATGRVNPGCDGIDLYREGRDYCYLWVETTVDLDMWLAYMLDIRTHVNGTETRDYLFVFVGAGNRFDVEWHQKPEITFAPDREPWERFESGMARLASFIEKAVEDATDACRADGAAT